MRWGDDQERYANSLVNEKTGEKTTSMVRGGLVRPFLLQGGTRGYYRGNRCFVSREESREGP